MKIKCNYCGNYLSDTDERCPNCQAPNENLKRVGNEVPQTIEELQQWYQDHNLPPEEVTRFFIGKNITEPRAFGIYLDEKTGNYVVYKNKDTGQRAVRYEGKDQTYAVNELYLKLKEEIQNQKARNMSLSSYPKDNGVPPSTNFKTSASIPNTNSLKTIFICFVVMFMLSAFFPPILMLATQATTYKQGYYESENNLYYLYNYCFVLSQKSCEWYKYNEKEDSWSEYYDKVKKPAFGGSSWDTSNKLYTKYDVNTQYYDEDWFHHLHPPTPTNGYYEYNDQMYYYYYGWYILNNGSWEKTSAPAGDIEYYPNTYYDDDKTFDDPYDFEDSSYYSNYSSSSYYDDYDYDYDSGSSWSSSSNDDWDSGSSWDSDSSWDSGSSDWGSDW